MSFNKFMNQVRYLDNKMARWMMRHFYILFFEILLVLIFLIFFANTLHVINLAFDVPKDQIVERLLLTQSISTLILIFLLFLNSFWMLYMFNCMMRMRSTLSEVNYHLIRSSRK